MANKSFRQGALWTGAGFCGISAVCFAVNAGATLLQHPEHTGELYGFATAAAIFAFVGTQLRDRIRERDAARRTVAPGFEPAALPGASPEWHRASAPPLDAAPVRVERDCPYCAERILAAAKICKHCRSDVRGV